MRFDTVVDKMRSNPDWLLVNYVSLKMKIIKNYLSFQDTMVLNDPEIVSLNLPAVTAVANVRDVSRLLSMIVEKVCLVRQCSRQNQVSISGNNLQHNSSRIIETYSKQLAF